jgi:thiamine-monophosphate kinase
MHPSAPGGPPKAGEFGLIRWIRDRTAPPPAAALGIGDDAAVLGLTPGSRLVVTTDMLMDGRHFRLDRDGAEAAGYKAMAVNVSDIAAMAARPVAAVVAVALPRGRGRVVDVGTRLHAGLSDAASRLRIPLVGGDTNAWDGPLVVCVTAIGETTDRGEVRRSGARPGDVIFVTGPLGGSLLGRHLRPSPRVDEALALHAAAPLRALIDISDGLASDLGRILEESGELGAVLDADAVPIHPDAYAMSAADGRAPLDHALNDGEDCELCVVVDPENAGRLEKNPPPPARLFRVGEIVGTPGLLIRDSDARLSAFEPAGFDHLKGG